MSVATATHNSPVGARFDWYACTVNAAVDDVRDQLAADIGGEWEPGSGERHGYHFKEYLKDSEGVTVVTMLHGGNGDLPHAFASSVNTMPFVESIRRHWPDRHKVSRMDAAIDYDDGPGTWERLLGIFEGIASGERVDGDVRKRASKLRTNSQGDWHHGVHGRTFYLGSKSSAVTAYIYEKGIQLNDDAEGHGQPATYSRDYVRVETRVRPAGASKVHAATATPLEAFGYAEWSRELLRRLDFEGVPRVHIKERRLSDHDRAMATVVKQYKKHLLKEVADLGGWEFLGEALRHRMEMGESGDSDTLRDRVNDQCGNKHDEDRPF
ncbi:MAG: replication initiation factor protein [Microbacterium sp.]|jgi:DNA relaxase NicK|nr:replication initiation factor protein [Microbacterium sp.]